MSVAPFTKVGSQLMVDGATYTETGGERSFTLNELDGTLVCSTPCVLEFKQAAMYMLAQPELLWQSCALDYAQRWPEHAAPTLQECTEFCAAVQIAQEASPEAQEGLE